MKLRATRLAVAFVALAGQAWADSSKLTTCLDNVDFGAFKDSQLVACQEQELLRQDRRLEAEYKKLQGEMVDQGAEASKALVLAERQWLQFREAQCSFEAKTGAAPSPEFNKAACMVELTEAQANQLAAEAN